MEGLRVIDAQTGEVVNEIYKGDRIIRKKSAEYLARTIEINSSTITGDR